MKSWPEDLSHFSGVCYHVRMAVSLDDPARFESNRYLYPEEGRWVLASPHMCCSTYDAVAAADCPHWPRSSLVEGNPHAPPYQEPESYSGFRSEPRPLMGELRLRYRRPSDDCLQGAYPNIVWIT